MLPSGSGQVADLAFDPGIGAMFDLTGNTAVVVGGTAGVGWAIAQLFARAGARVAAIDTDGVTVPGSGQPAPVGVTFGACDLHEPASVAAAGH